MHGMVEVNVLMNIYSNAELTRHSASYVDSNDCNVVVYCTAMDTGVHHGWFDLNFNSHLRILHSESQSLHVHCVYSSVKY